MAERESLDYFLFAGERSGDVLGADFIDSLEGSCGGVGGPLMREKAFKNFIEMERFQAMGFIGLIRHLPRLIYLFHKVKRLILQMNPKNVVLIDYPGFNLRMAKALKKSGYRGRIIQYVCPSIWAWRKGRKQTMIENLDLLLTILPFEPELFKDTPLEARYVGHPLAKKAMPPAAAKPILGLFPGSRKSEIARNLPIQLRVAERIREKWPEVEVRISHVDEKERLKPEECQVALATSGTVILELALAGVPTVVNYAIRPLDEWIAKHLFQINLPFYSLPNIIMRAELFPEFYGSNLCENKLFSSLSDYISNPNKRELTRYNCSKLSKKLSSIDKY
ncbi:MAG: lipid-A-disaccharide synthase [Simkaniaceae bacterium]|nr:lipid-A-disaccharide synthase [Simkaniaceae bacterium]